MYRSCCAGDEIELLIVCWLRCWYAAPVLAAFASAAASDPPLLLPMFPLLLVFEPERTYRSSAASARAAKGPGVESAVSTSTPSASP